MKLKIIIKKALYILLILFIGFITFLLYQTKDDIKADLTNIDGKLNQYYNPNKMAGFAVSVFNADEIIYSKGFGYADKENKIPYDTKTQQYIASVSKTTIGLALMKAEELNLLNIDHPINDYLPFKIINPSFPNEPISLLQLATHTSSLSYNEPVVESNYIEESKKKKSLKNFMLDYFKDKKYGEITFSDYKPGTNWDYSNIGSGLAAYIIELRSGMAFSEFTEQHLFEPLELNNTHWFKSDSDSSSHTCYYEPAKDSITDVETNGIILYPARDLITNVSDLTKYCQAILSSNSLLLNPKSYNKLLTPKLKTKTSNLEDDNMALFFIIDRNNLGITYQLTGMDGGDYSICTMMWFDVKTKLGYIFIGNTGFGKLNRSNHIMIYNALVSLGYNYTLSQSSFAEKLKLRWHNVYNRIAAIF